MVLPYYYRYQYQSTTVVQQQAYHPHCVQVHNGTACGMSCTVRYCCVTLCWYHCVQVRLYPQTSVLSSQYRTVWLHGGPCQGTCGLWPVDLTLVHRTRSKCDNLVLVLWYGLTADSVGTIIVIIVMIQSHVVVPPP